MMIRTKLFKIEPNQLQSILITRYFKRRWWIVLILIAMVGLTYLLEGLNDLRTFLLIFTAVFPMLIVWQFWRYAHSKDNRIFYLKRQLNIDGDTIEANLEDGTTHPVKTSHIINYEELPSYYMLNISKATFVAIPKGAFESTEDEIRFKKEFLTQLKER